MQFFALAHDTARRYLYSPPCGVLMTCHDVPSHCSAKLVYFPSAIVCEPTATQLVGLVHETLKALLDSTQAASSKLEDR